MAKTKTKTKRLDAEFYQVVAQLRQTERVTFAARVVNALRSRRRVWITELAPMRRVWIASSSGIVSA